MSARRKFIIKIFLWLEMSSDDNHWPSHMTPTIVEEGHYMLFLEQSCLTVVCQMTCQRSHISWCASWWHNVFVLLVQFALVHFVWLRQKLVLLSFKKTTVHINLLEYFYFLEIDVCVYPSLCWLCSLSDILARHDSNTVYRCSRKKYVDYFVCSICRYGIDQALFHQLKVFG